MRAPGSTFDRARTLRREMTLPEVLLWQAIRRRQLDGLLIRRQHPVGPYVLDFDCPARGLSIEVDGAAHDGADRAARDRRRDAWLCAQGIRVVRFRAIDILRETSRLDVLPPSRPWRRPDSPDVPARPGPGAARRYNLCEADGSAVREDIPCVPSRCWPDWPWRAC